jgi:hypothetical protein
MMHISSFPDRSLVVDILQFSRTSFNFILRINLIELKDFFHELAHLNPGRETYTCTWGDVRQTRFLVINKLISG